jgi:hypothetical protein
VDSAYEFCPHCGYEFAQGEELPAGVEETNGGIVPGEQDYLVRIRTLQDLLSDMERELDLIIRTSSKDS